MPSATLTRWPTETRGVLRRFLREHPYWAGLDERALSEVEAAARVRELERGQVYALEGDPCDAICFVLIGRIDAVKLSAEGRRQVVNVVQAGQSFYLVPALDGGTLPVTTVAATRSLLACFRGDAFLALLERHPSLMRAIAGDLAHRLRRMGDLVADLSLRSVPQRLARLLLERAEGRLPSRMTQRDMAAQLGTAREVVARCLGRFQDEGWVRVGRGVIEVLDAEALRHEAAD